MVMVRELGERPRIKRRDKNLQRILDAALELVEEGGLEGLSIQRLAAKVDYTAGALYRYFESKDAILAQLVMRILRDLRAYLDAAVALLPSDAPVLARVWTLALGYRAFALREPRRFGLLAMTLASPRVLLTEAGDADPVALEMISGLQGLAEAITVATEAEALSADQDVETSSVDRTLCLFAFLQGLSLMQKQARYAPERLDTQRLSESGTRALLLGWGAKGSSIDAALVCVKKSVALRTHFGGIS